MSRTEPVSIYVTPEEKKHLQSEADAADETLSSYVYKLVQKQRQAEEVDRAVTEIDAEERVEAMIREGVDALEEAAQDVRDVNARAGCYSIVGFRLLQRQFQAPEPWVTDEFVNARDKLRVPFEQHDPLEGIPTGTDDDRDATGTDDDRDATGTDAEDDSKPSLEDRLRGGDG